jgi:2'-5' RNA ligase
MMAPTARLFFAIWPDAAARARLYAHAQALHKDCGGRVTRRDNLHLTLVFLGSVARAQIAQIEAAAARCDGPCFEFALDTTGYWRHNRIVWAAPAAVPAPLRGLVASLESGLAASGCTLDRRPYEPHLTLIRNAREPRLPPALELAWPVTEFTLVESTRDAHGARYDVIARWPLAASS